MPSNNFQVFNSGSNFPGNALSDPDYTSNTTRTGGVTAGPASPSLYNKFFRQASIMAYALGKIVEDEGGDASDASASNLVTALKSVILRPSPFYTSGRGPLYSNASTITLPVGLGSADSTNTDFIQVTGSPVTVNLATSGAGGLDAGAEAANTWYYVYLIKNVTSGTVSAVFSIVNESVSGSITLPSGYTLKKQLPIAVRNNGSSNIIPFFVEGWGTAEPYIKWDTTMGRNGGSGIIMDFSGNATNVLTGGVASDFTDIGCSSYIPPISRRGTFLLLTGAGYMGFIRGKDETVEYMGPYAGTSVDIWCRVPDLRVNASQQIQYKTGNAASPVDINVEGFRVTEIA